VILGSHAFDGNHGHSHWRQGDQRELEMLNSEGDPNNGEKAGQCRRQVADGKPPSRHQEPNDIADQSQWTGSQIATSGMFKSVDRFVAERPERETPDHNA